MRYRVKFFEKDKWVLKAGFVYPTDAIVFAKDLSARWPQVKVAMFINGHISKDYVFVAGKRLI